MYVNIFLNSSYLEYIVETITYNLHNSVFFADWNSECTKILSINYLTLYVRVWSLVTSMLLGNDYGVIKVSLQLVLTLYDITCPVCFIYIYIYICLWTRATVKNFIVCSSSSVTAIKLESECIFCTRYCISCTLNVAQERRYFNVRQRIRFQNCS